jgi:hypothetical protein
MPTLAESNLQIAVNKGGEMRTIFVRPPATVSRRCTWPVWRAQSTEQLEFMTSALTRYNVGCLEFLAWLRISWLARAKGTLEQRLHSNQIDPRENTQQHTQQTTPDSFNTCCAHSCLLLQTNLSISHMKSKILN